jgi:hypothetical protein
MTTPHQLPARQATEHVQLGTPLRDAAVESRPDDFMPPTNAGRPESMGNPHGSHVTDLRLDAIGTEPRMSTTRPGAPLVG